MSHKSGHIIINAIKPLPSYTALPQEVRNQLDDIEARDEYNLMDKLVLGYAVSKIAAEPSE